MPPKKRKATAGKGNSGRKAEDKKKDDLQGVYSEEAPRVDTAELRRPNYWLIKSSTKSRVKKNTETKYTIEDLMAEDDQSISWVGVRNEEASSLMRKMRQGDLVLFYHSNCQDPGFVGIVSVISNPYADPESPCYDEHSSKDHPQGCSKYSVL